MLTPSTYLAKLKTALSQAGDPEYAEKQMAYMKNHFEFYGLNAAAWMGISKVIFKEEGMYTDARLKEFVRLCFEDDHREVHYIALQMVGKTLKKQDESFIEFLEELILKQSWWDSVDWISKFVSLHFQRFPKNIKPITGRWIESDNIWLQRMAIIFQRYKKYPTDWALLQKYILRRANSSEFFVQKAAGWALRDHSKIDAAAVVGFVEAHPELSNLTQREALKWLKERGLF